MHPNFRRAVSSLVLTSACAWALAASAQAPAGVKLFKFVSTRDEIVVGLDAAQLGAGSGPEVGRLAAMLADKGQLTVWQYASHKEPGGELVQAPLRQVAIFKNDAVRIEPYSTPLPVKPIGAAK
ncbi:MAG: hypothetical protein ABJA77_08670 [Variovorax sp.]